MSSIKLKHASGNSMSIAAPATNPASDLSLKLPATVGTAHQLLRNSGTAGTLEFTHNHVFEGKRSGNQSGYNGNSLTSIVEFDSENYDTGSNFNTSTHLFTVPETGLYHFIAGARNDETKIQQAWLVVNGSRRSYTDWIQTTTSNFISSSHIEYLTAGDTVGYHIHTSDGSSTILQSVNHTYFKGYKVH